MDNDKAYFVTFKFRINNAQKNTNYYLIFFVRIKRVLLRNIVHVYIILWCYSNMIRSKKLEIHYLFF